jgi:hypothetical protein
MVAFSRFVLAVLRILNEEVLFLILNKLASFCFRFYRIFLNVLQFADLENPRKSGNLPIKKSARFAGFAA